MNVRRAVVTGADGFVGRTLCHLLLQNGWNVRALVRTPQESLPVARGAEGIPGCGPGTVERCIVGDLASAQDAVLLRALDSADLVFHLAGRAHRLREAAPGVDLEASYMADNLEVTRRMAELAAVAGVPRFIYLSSIKALADVSEAPLTADAVPAPQDAYGRSKLAAERFLAAFGSDASMTVSTVRPPLVYGPGVKGNLALLLQAVSRGVPLPLARARAPRSMVSVANLCALLLRLADHEGGVSVFHVRDDDDLCAADLVAALARLLHRSPRLIAFPPKWLLGIDRLTGSQWYPRLFAPLRVDDTKTRQQLNWQPPVSVDDGLAEMVSWWQAQR